MECENVHAKLLILFEYDPSQYVGYFIMWSVKSYISNFCFRFPLGLKWLVIYNQLDMKFYEEKGGR